MLGRLRGLVRRRGPVGALALATIVGATTGLLALNVVLAGWTYRDAARRDLRAPGRWALAVLLAGPVAFVPYGAVQWYRDRSEGSDRSDSDEAGNRDRVRTAPSDGTGDDAVDRDEADPPPGSLGEATVRYGGKAAALGARGARWAGRRAVARMNNG